MDYRYLVPCPIVTQVPRWRARCMDTFQNHWHIHLSGASWSAEVALPSESVGPVWVPGWVSPGWVGLWWAGPGRASPDVPAVIQRMSGTP